MIFSDTEPSDTDAGSRRLQRIWEPTYTIMYRAARREDIMDLSTVRATLLLVLSSHALKPLPPYCSIYVWKSTPAC